MKLEKEITVRVNCTYDLLHNDLINKGFKIVEEYQVNDIYLAPTSINIESCSVFEILQSCILLRDIVGITKKLVYKYKKYNESNEILEQGKVQCVVDNIEDSLKFMEKINYKNIFTVEDKCIVYSNNEIVLVAQIVNDKYIFIEIEDTNEHTNKVYNNVEDMKKDLTELKLDCDFSNYSVRKAEIIFKDKYRNN